MDVAAFYRDFDKHPGDRIRLFGALAEFVQPVTVLYPGSYVDVAPSVFFDDVTYVDMDRRAARFFDQKDDVHHLVAGMRAAESANADFDLQFIHSDYEDELPVDLASVDLLISLYAGFVSEHCSRYLKPHGYLFANNSHGDASMASLDPAFELAAVVTLGGGRYAHRATDLDSYMVPKSGRPVTAAGLHEARRGPAYTKSPFAYLFTKKPA